METILSRETAGLYRDLVGGKYHVVRRSAAGVELCESERELVDAGFARVSDTDPPTLTALPPAQVAQFVLRDMSTQLASWHRNASRAVDELMELQRVAGGDPNDRPMARVVTDHDEVLTLSGDLQRDAREELLSWDMVLPAGALCEPRPSPALDDPPPQWRTIYTNEFAGPELCWILDGTVGRGGQVRLIRSLPMKLLVADRRQALVPLDSTGLGGAVLFESPTAIDGLRAMFDAFWDRASPYPPERDTAGVLTPYEKYALDLLVAGLKDDDIAARTHVSVRTVRRHVASILDKLGVDTRFAAGVQAAKRGWT